MTADLNMDIRRPDDSRGEEICNFLARLGIAWSPPSHEGLYTHTSRAHGNNTLLDWIGYSDKYKHIICHEWSKGLTAVTSNAEFILVAAIEPLDWLSVLFLKLLK